MAKANGDNFFRRASRSAMAGKLAQAGRQRPIVRGRHDDLDLAKNCGYLQLEVRNPAVARVPPLARIDRGLPWVRGLRSPMYRQPSPITG